GTRCVADEGLLTVGDLVGYLVVRHEAGAPGPGPGHEAGTAARRERRRPRCGGHAGKSTCRDHSVSRRRTVTRPARRAHPGTDPHYRRDPCTGRTCWPVTGAGGGSYRRSTPSPTSWSRTPTPASAVPWSASSPGRSSW